MPSSRVVKTVLSVLLLCGCGRLWFEPVADASADATNDATADASRGPDASNDAATDTDANDAATDAQAPSCTWSAPEEITGLNVTGALWGPTLSQDGLTLYFARAEGSEEEILVATRPDRGTAFNPATVVPGIQSMQLDGTPHLSSDERTLYFFSTRPGGVGGRDIWYATRGSSSDPFGAPNLLPNVNTSDTEYVPRVSPDSLTVWVSSGRSGGSGSMDIWTSTRSSRTENFPALRLWSEINSPSFEAAVTFSSDGLFVVFASDRGSSQQLDLWMATRESTTAPFGTPESIALANTSENEGDPILSADDSELFYSSVRDGSRKLWRLRRVCN